MYYGCIGGDYGQLSKSLNHFAINLVTRKISFRVQTAANAHESSLRLHSISEGCLPEELTAAGST